jgi:hypothetical protein
MVILSDTLGLFRLKEPGQPILFRWRDFHNRMPRDAGTMADTAPPEL